MQVLLAILTLAAPLDPVESPFAADAYDSWQQARIQQVLKARKTMGKGRDTVPRKTDDDGLCPAGVKPEPASEATPAVSPGQQTGSG